MPSKSAVIVDSSYLIYRSFFAYPDLTVKLSPDILGKYQINKDIENMPVGAFFGFSKTVFYLLRDFNPDFLVFAFDLPKPTFRHQLQYSYKAGRPEPDPNMILQFPLIQNWCKKISPYNFKLEGFEADDCVYSTVCNNSILDKVFIFSADRDLYQIFNQSQVEVKFVKPKIGQKVELFEKGDFIKKYAVEPHQWVDFKALVGDNSDNLPGVAGIGEKTAAKFLQKFNSIKEILNLNLEKISIDLKPNEKKLLQKIQNQKEQVLLTKKMATLVSLKECELDQKKIEMGKGMEMLSDFKFSSLIKLQQQLTEQKNQLTQESLF